MYIQYVYGTYTNAFNAMRGAVECCWLERAMYIVYLYTVFKCIGVLVGEGTMVGPGVVRREPCLPVTESSKEEEAPYLHLTLITCLIIRVGR